MTYCCVEANDHRLPAGDKIDGSVYCLARVTWQGSRLIRSGRRLGIQGISRPFSEDAVGWLGHVCSLWRHHSFSLDLRMMDIPLLISLTPNWEQSKQSGSFHVLPPLQTLELHTMNILTHITAQCWQAEKNEYVFLLFAFHHGVGCYEKCDYP